MYEEKCKLSVCILFELIGGNSVNFTHLVLDIVINFFSANRV